MNKLMFTVGQWAFIIVVPIVVLIVLFLIVFFPLKNRKMKQDYKYFYYKRIYKLAMDKDYYLINNFLFRIDDTHVGKIDHILFANKYIYIVNDCFYDGDIDGKENDPSIIFINKLGRKNYEDNPIVNNKKIMNRLSLVTGINTSLMIGITLINDNCSCAINTTTKNYYVVRSNKFRALVKAIESRPIGNINPEQLANAVKAIDKLNRRKRNASGK